MHKHWWAGLMLGCSMAVAAGPGHRTTMKDAEASMLLTGTINVDPTGAVTSFTIDHRDKVPSGVVQLVDSTVPQWRFEPVTREGHAVAAKTTMSMLVVATRSDPTHFQISVKGATFGDGMRDDERVTKKSMQPPTYPLGPLYSGVSGIAYVVIRIDHLGMVSDAAVEQVNLRALGSAHESDKWRKAFADSALHAAKQWSFNVPAAATPDDDQFVSVRVPVDFRFSDDMPKYGVWTAYVPGPRETIPWMHLHDMDDWSVPDALVAGGVYQPGKGLHLLTPLGEG